MWLIVSGRQPTVEAVCEPKVNIPGEKSLLVASHTTSQHWDKEIRIPLSFVRAFSALFPILFLSIFGKLFGLYQAP